MDQQHVRRTVRRVAALTSAVAVAGCSAAAPGAPASTYVDAITPVPTTTAAPATRNGLPVPDHVMVVVLENKDVDQILGSPDAPFLTSLAERSASFTDFHAETHPSQPNYIALFSGDTHGVGDNDCVDTLNAPSLGGALIAAGHTFTGYAEDLPETGYTGCSDGDYARKHNPWVNFPDIPAAANRPYSDLPVDYARLPTVAFVTPNMCHDMHDCDVATGDRWMRDEIGPYADWAAGHNSLLVVTFDESESTDGENRVVTLFSGQKVRPGTYGDPVDHYSVLRTLEDMYGLDPLGRSADSAPITQVWTRS